METIALAIILTSILATITLSVCLAFDEAFGNWHIRPFGWRRWRRRRRRRRFGRHGRHRIHKRDIKLSVNKTKEPVLHETYSDILKSQDLANTYIANNTNISTNNTRCVGVGDVGTKLELLNDVVNFAIPQNKSHIIIK